MRTGKAVAQLRVLPVGVSIWFLLSGLVSSESKKNRTSKAKFGVGSYQIDNNHSKETEQPHE
jgi:hypothetical protein